MVLTGLIGHPVAQSASPRIHAHWMAQHAIAGAYEAVDVPPGGVRDAVQALADKGFIGLNVTVPHKVEALGVCDDISPTARAIGAVNTLLMRDGRIYGDNTDSYGFSAALLAHLPPFSEGGGRGGFSVSAMGPPPNPPLFKGGEGVSGPPLKGGECVSGPPLKGGEGVSGPLFQWGAGALVLGAGGAARAVVHALAALGAPEIRVAARRPEAIEAMAAILAAPKGGSLASSRLGVYKYPDSRHPPAPAGGPGKPKPQGAKLPRGGSAPSGSQEDARLIALPWPAPRQALAGIGLLVNTTSLGMAGQGPLPIDLAALPPGAVVCDIVYKPLMTALLAAARARGNPAVTGIGMLLHQAAKSFHLWHGVMPAVTPALERFALTG